MQYAYLVDRLCVFILLFVRLTFAFCIRSIRGMRTSERAGRRIGLRLPVCGCVYVCARVRLQYPVHCCWMNVLPLIEVKAIQTDILAGLPKHHCDNQILYGQCSYILTANANSRSLSPSHRDYVFPNKNH